MMMTMTRALLALGLAGTMALGACDDGAGGDKTPVADPIEIAGTWTSQFGDTETISETHWSSTYLAVEVVSFDNAANAAITRNPADAQYDPGEYGKTVWTEPTGGAFYYCTAAYGLATAAEAEAAPVSAVDANDVEGAGCGGFPWTKLTAP